MTFPPLVPGWGLTRDSLHRAARVLGAIRVAAIDPLPNDLHHSLQPVPLGCSTGELALGGELILDFTKGAISCVEGGEERFSVGLKGLNQRSLVEALVRELAAAGKALEVASEKLTSEEPFDLHPMASADASSVFAWVWNALARFRARLSGYMTPVVLWHPHHFDLSFLWFPGPGTDEKTDRQMNFGFAPFSEGFDAPYLFGYAWPLDEGAPPPALVAPARWHTEGWTGAVVDYADFAAAATPQQVIEEVMMEIFGALTPLLATEEGGT